MPMVKEKPPCHALCVQVRCSELNGPAVIIIYHEYKVWQESFIG